MPHVGGSPGNCLALGAVAILHWPMPASMTSWSIFSDTDTMSLRNSKKKQRLIAETCRETTQRLCPNPVWAFFQACLNIGKYPKIEWFIRYHHFCCYKIVMLITPPSDFGTLKYILSHHFYIIYVKTMFLEKEACLVPFLELGGPVDQFKFETWTFINRSLDSEKINITHLPFLQQLLSAQQHIFLTLNLVRIN